MNGTQSLNLSNPSLGEYNMPNSTTSRQLAKIRAQYEAQQAAINERRRALLSSITNSPQVHWCGVSERTISTLRSNREALTSIENGAYAPVSPVSQSSYYFPRLAPQVGSLVEHVGFGLGIVDGAPYPAANAGMAVPVYFEGVDRCAIVFCDELEMLEGELRGTTADTDNTIATRATRATIKASKAMAAKYDSPDLTEDEEDADDAAFAEFMASEFDID